MSSRPILSRPRTRVYNANYNIGESYYRPALDRLDRKYGGRPLSPPRQSSIPGDILDRHGRIFADEDLEASRRRAEKHIAGSNLFDSRGARLSRALNLDNGLEEETASSLSRIRAAKKVSAVDDVDLESAVSNITSRRLLDRQDRILKSVGVDKMARRALDEDVIVKRRALRVSYEDDHAASDLTKWTPIVKRRDESAASAAAVETTSAASIRARQSKDRLLDLEDEMAEIAERQAIREKRAARIKALVAENAEETQAVESAMKAVSIRSRREKIVED